MSRVLLALLAALLALVLAAGVRAQTGGYAPGDLFVSVGGGIVRVFDPNGTQLAELDTQTASDEIGDMCFSNGAMYSINFSDRSISKFDSSGKLVEARWATVPGGAIESCVLDASGNLYVGEDGDEGGQMVKIDTGGRIVKTFSPDVVNSGTEVAPFAGGEEGGGRGRGRRIAGGRNRAG